MHSRAPTAIAAALITVGTAAAGLTLAGPTLAAPALAGSMLAGSTLVAPSLAGSTLAGSAAGGPVSTAYESSPVGFGAGTTGGAAGSTVTVTTYAQLIAEAKSAVPRVIRVNGMIQGAQETIYVTSNKTIVGVGASSGVTGGGFFVKKAANVILRNLKISLARAPVDLIQIQKSDHVWVDHNELFNDTAHDKDYYDGLLDINHGSNLITVSWNRLHDHYKGSLVGHSDKNAAEDSGNLKVTYSHNWFEGVQARLPRVRFGTVHTYNNFFSNAVTSGIHCLMGAQCLVQNNVFRSVTLPIWTTEDSPVDGFAVQNGNDFGGVPPVITQTGSFTTPPYPYSMEPASAVEGSVKSGAGTGKVG
jgi:pectate lyase